MSLCYAFEKLGQAEKAVNDYKYYLDWGLKAKPPFHDPNDFDTVLYSKLISMIKETNPKQVTPEVTLLDIKQPGQGKQILYYTPDLFIPYNIFNRKNFNIKFSGQVATVYKYASILMPRYFHYTLPCRRHHENEVRFEQIRKLILFIRDLVPHVYVIVTHNAQYAEYFNEMKKHHADKYVNVMGGPKIS